MGRNRKLKSSKVWYNRWESRKREGVLRSEEKVDGIPGNSCYSPLHPLLPHLHTSLNSSDQLTNTSIPTTTTHKNETNETIPLSKPQAIQNLTKPLTPYKFIPTYKHKSQQKKEEIHSQKPISREGTILPPRITPCPTPSLRRKFRHNRFPRRKWSIL
jgi:hypothetical protein